MPLYESDTLTREELGKKRKWNVCVVCGEWLNMFLDPENHKAFIACHDFLRTHHEGIARENNELRTLNIPTRRREMAEQFGEEKTKALAKYQMSALISRQMATEIVETLWRGAPVTEKTKAILLCYTYNLNPLMNHLFMLPFQNKKTGRIDWVVAIGIEATRLMAHRKHNYTYLDLTPRRATDQELEKILGNQVDTKKLYVITKGKDLDTGAEAYGLGAWEGAVYGIEKGNTPFNMASIRSERQFLKRLYPAEMPSGIEVVDEQFISAAGSGTIEADYHVVDEHTEENIEEQKSDTASDQLPGALEATKKAVNQETSAVAPVEPKKTIKPTRDPATIKPIEKKEEPPAQVGFVNLDWAIENLKILTREAPKTWGQKEINDKLVKLDAKGKTMREALSSLPRDKADQFVKEIQNALQLIGKA